ncbi:Uncharacterised protein [Chlamydia abortus]|nr:Uncharacterised protein [Chlamydia abortus]
MNFIDFRFKVRTTLVLEKSAAKRAFMNTASLYLIDAF